MAGTDRNALLFATSGHSGVDRVIANLLPEFGRTEHLFDLLVIGQHGPWIPADLPQNIRVVRLPVRTKKLVLFPLLAYLIRHRPYALLTANHQLNRAALLARRLAGCPTRVTIRMGMSLTALGAEMGERRRARLFASMRRWYPLADAVIAPSEGVGADLLDIAHVPPRRLHVIRNPIVNPLLRKKAAAALDHPWFASGEPPVILGVGSLEPRKDFATLIRAFARVHEQHACRLLILGEGSEKDALRALARSLGVENAVALPGFDSNPYRYMRRAAVFALSSRREGASAVIVEALACGTPVVSTDCPSGPAEVLHGVTPRALVPIGDADALGEALLTMMRNPPPTETLHALTRAHDSETSARAYLRTLQGKP